MGYTFPSKKKKIPYRVIETTFRKIFSFWRKPPSFLSDGENQISLPPKSPFSIGGKEKNLTSLQERE